MKFTIRFADQVVGALVIAGLGVLVLVIVMLGVRHRWFAQDYLYVTYLDTATGIGPNMAVQYKGFTIGNVKNFDLTDDNQVKVVFSIYDTYNNRVREGSLVELAASPVGLGNHFYFYSGKGQQLEENAFIPTVNSPEARRLQTLGLAEPVKQDDSITLLINQVNRTLEEVNKTLGDLDGTILDVRDALAGTEASSLGRIVLGAERTINELPASVEDTLAALLRDIEPILANIQTLTGELSDPLQNPEGFFSANLQSLFQSISAITENLDKTAAMLPSEMAQVAGLLAELRTTLKSADDVLVALANNPLLRKGVPQPVQTQSSGTSPRDISF